MTERYRIEVTKDYLVFSSGHFITYDRDTCERLHGHNYRLWATIEGPLDENHYVVDFIAVRNILQELCQELDHHMLLPTTHPLIQVEAGETEVEVRFRERRWVFPRGDCRLLPIANTTTELLARHIGHQLLDRLEARTGTRPHTIRITLDECFGQVAMCELVGE
jgi:6-pyruvoyltetrahydropterin/6-carboxytetrahydropterin synthase